MPCNVAPFSLSTFIKHCNWSENGFSVVTLYWRLSLSFWSGVSKVKRLQGLSVRVVLKWFCICLCISLSLYFFVFVFVLLCLSLCVLLFEFLSSSVTLCCQWWLHQGWALARSWRQTGPWGRLPLGSSLIVTDKLNIIGKHR